MSNGVRDLSGPHTFQFRFAAAQASATTNEEFVAFQVPTDVPTGITLVSAKWVPDAAVTANGTNYTTVSVRNRTTGAGTALPFTRSYAATNSTAFVAESMTASGTAADLLAAAGDILTAQRLYTGTGLAVCAGIIVVTYTIR